MDAAGGAGTMIAPAREGPARIVCGLIAWRSRPVLAGWKEPSLQEGAAMRRRRWLGIQPLDR